MFILVFLAWLQIICASNVNLLPLPRQINWLDYSPIPINGCLTLDVVSSLNTSIVLDAFNRTMQTVYALQFFPPAADNMAANNTGYNPIANLTSGTNSSYSSFPLFNSSVANNGNITIDEVYLTIKNDADLQLGVDESYTMTIGSNVTIEAATTWGALHAFNTLQQLIVFKNGTFYVEGSVAIYDVPLFPHRGIMIDTARNFITLDDIKDQISIMALTKLNTLHLHLTDTQSWPIEIETYPEMTKDAYSSDEVYTTADIADLIEFARARGVRVVPEIDMPGHSKSGWRQVDANLVECGNSVWNGEGDIPPTAAEPGPGQLDILYNNTYNVVKNVYDELSALFTDNIFHVGMDELNEACYLQGNDTKSYLQNNTIRDLAQYWLDHALPFLNKNRLTMWADIVVSANLAHNVSKDIILQVWLEGTADIQNVTSQGYDVILSPSNFLYLDCGMGSSPGNDPRYYEVAANDDFNNGAGGSWCGPYKTWQRIYDWDILTNLTIDQTKHVLGAEAAVWTEMIDSTILTSIIWPRTASLSELLWSGNRDPTTGYLRTYWLTARIANFRQYLVALGYDAHPLMPVYCLQDVHSCDIHPDPSSLDEYGTFFYNSNNN